MVVLVGPSTWLDDELCGEHELRALDFVRFYSSFFTIIALGVHGH